MLLVSFPHLMKYSSFPLLLGLALISLTCSPCLAQRTDPENIAEPTEDTEIVQVWRDFMNLPIEKRKDFGTKLLKVQNLFNQKRIFDALEKIDELDAIFPNHPAAMNIKGACYVEMRSFDKATAIFEKILEIAPKNVNVQFNIAEVNFVTGKWNTSHDRFEKLIPLLGTNNKPMKRICEFKLLLCKLKMNRIQEAKAISEKYDEWDDSPLYYYARAALLYHANNKPEADKMLRNAKFVWQNDAVLAPWQDTLIEFGYIRSFYGGDRVDNLNG